MGVGKGLVVFSLVALWVVAFPLMVLIETLRYGCELMVESLEAALKEARAWVDRKEKV